MTAADRREARAALRQYPRLLRRRAEPKLTPTYGGIVVQHSGENRSTENIALASTLTESEERIVAAVDFALAMQGRCYNAAERRRMVELVYFRRTHTLDGAALEVGYSVEAVKKWNAELITAVYVGLKKP